MGNWARAICKKRRSESDSTQQLCAKFYRNRSFGFLLLYVTAVVLLKGNYLLTSAKHEVEPKIASMARMMNATLVGYCAVTFFVVMELDILYFFFGLWTAVYLNARRLQPNLLHLGFTRSDTTIICGTMIVILCMIWLAAVKQIV